jgi:D-aminoacyl-tRNA deacylase
MRVVIQRVVRAEVRVDGQVVGRIGRGLLVLVGFASGDTPESGRAIAERIVNLRVFDNEQGKMDRSILEMGGGLMVVSRSRFMEIAAKVAGQITPWRLRPNQHAHSTRHS